MFGLLRVFTHVSRCTDITECDSNTLLTDSTQYFRCLQNQSEFPHFLAGIATALAALLLPYATRRLGNRVCCFGIGAGTIFAGCVLGAIAKLCNSFELMIASHMLTYGIGWTFSYGPGSAYLAECAPAHLRGTVGSYANIGIQVGGLLAYSLGFEEVLGSDDLWPWYWALGAVPSLVALCACGFLWESPKRVFFAGKENYEQQTYDLLRKLYGRSEDGFSEVLKEFKTEAAFARRSIISPRKFFTCRQLRPALITVTVAAIYNNTCGGSIISNYSTAMYTELGFSRLISNVMTVAMQIPAPVVSAHWSLHG